MVARREVVASLDIGTSHVRCVIGEINQRGSFNIIGLGNCPSSGIKKGTVVDIESTVRCISQAADMAQRMAGVAIDSVFVGLPATHASLVLNRGIVAVSSDDKEITEDDVERVLQAARVINLPPNREILDVVPRQYIIDGYEGIRSPAGMAGIRLEVEALLVTGAMTSVQNLIRCVERAGLNVNSLVLNAMAAGEVALSPDEKELGVVLVDIGGGTCEIAYFHSGALQSIGAIPLGGDHVTSDVSIGLRTSLQVAEKSKLDYGSLYLASDDQQFDIPDVGGQENRVVSVRKLNGIIEARVMEMLGLITEEFPRMKVPEVIPSGIVLAGGVSQTKGLSAFSRELMHCSVRIAQDGMGGIDDPAYATAIGIIAYAMRSQSTSDVSRPARKERRSGGLMAKVAGWFKEMWE